MTEVKKPDQAPAVAAGTARCRVLKNGDGKISKGVHDLNGEHYYAKGDEFTTEKTIADNLEDRGFVEIQ